MNGMMIKLLLCIALLIAAADGTGRNSISEQEATDCMSVGMKLLDCTKYLSVGSTLTKPEQGCCPSLKEVLVLNASCLCAAVEGAAGFGITLNMTRVPGLPKLCGINKLPPAAQCNFTVPPTPSPIVPTPSPSVPTPSHGAPQPSTPVNPPTKPPTTAPPPSSPSASAPTPAPPTPTPINPPPTPATPATPPTPTTPSSPAPATPSTPAPTTPSTPAPATPTAEAPSTPAAEAPAPSPKSSGGGISLTPLAVVSAVMAVAPFLVA